MVPSPDARVRLTGQWGRGKMAKVMLRAFRAMRPVAGAIVVAVVVMLSANCLGADVMTPAQKACCAAMAHDCGHMALTEACCTGQAQEHQGMAAASRAEIAAVAVPVLIAVLQQPEPLTRNGQTVALVSETPVKPPGTSTYLLVSSFRI